MIGQHRFRHVMVLCVAIMVVNIILLFHIYNDLLFAIVLTLVFWILSFLTIGIFGIFIPYIPKSPNTNQELLHPRAFLVGILSVLLLVGDDLILQSDNLVKPWFWSAAICIYMGCLMGVVSITYLLSRTREKIVDNPSESEIVSNGEQISDTPLD